MIVCTEAFSRLTHFLGTSRLFTIRIIQLSLMKITFHICTKEEQHVQNIS